MRNCGFHGVKCFVVLFCSFLRVSSFLKHPPLPNQNPAQRSVSDAAGIAWQLPQWGSDNGEICICSLCKKGEIPLLSEKLRTKKANLIV